MEIGSGGETEMEYSYRTELLSPTPSTGDHSSWRLDIDKFRLPQRHSSAQPFGFRRLLRIPRKQGKIAEYYEKQEKLLEGFTEMETINETGCLPGSLTEDEMKQLARSERMAIYVSNIANLVLFVAKVFASIESRSFGFPLGPPFGVHTVVYFVCYEKSKSEPLSNWKEENATGG